MGTFRSAATTARRSERDGSPLTSAPSVSTTSSSVTAMSPNLRRGRNGLIGASAGASDEPMCPDDRRTAPSTRDHAPRRRQASSPFPCHRSSGGGHRAHERVGVGLVERQGHLVLFLEEQLVLFAAGAAMELDPDTVSTRRASSMATVST